MGRYDLLLSEEEFWGLTWKEFNALSERCKTSHDWLNYRAALICSVLANTVRDPKKKSKPYTPQDFMPGEKHNRPSKKQSAKQMLRTARMLNAAHGGNVKEN